MSSIHETVSQFFNYIQSEFLPSAASNGKLPIKGALAALALGGAALAACYRCMERSKPQPKPRRKFVVRLSTYRNPRYLTGVTGFLPPLTSPSYKRAVRMERELERDRLTLAPVSPHASKYRRDPSRRCFDANALRIHTTPSKSPIFPALQLEEEWDEEENERTPRVATVRHRSASFANPSSPISSSEDWD